MRHDPRAYLALAGATLGFGSLAVAAKVALTALEPLALAAARATLGGALLFALHRLARPERVPRADWPRLAGLALLGVVVNQLLFLVGVSLTGAIAATVLVATIPVFTLLVAAGLGVERLTRRKTAGAATAVAGIVVLLGAEALSGLTASLLGDVLVVLNALSYSFYLVLARPTLARYSSTTVAAWTFLFGALAIDLLAAPAVLRTDWLALPTDAVLALAWIVLAGTLAAYALSNWALKRADASTVAAFVPLQPLVAALLGVALLGEAVTPRLLAGGALVLAGVVLVVGGASAKAPDAAAGAPRP